ncbi:MAG: FAD binding domain-containing protein, partial [Planctomycetaceae bacterium]|nr:FAD binding domain-containing protein [Planctomycetaceae bacterium]
MNAFDFAAPASIEDALKLLDGQNTVALSGGTDLLSRIKDQVTVPRRVVYLKDI